MPHLTTTRSLVVPFINFNFLLFCASILSLNLTCTGEEAGNINNDNVHGSEFPMTS